MTVTKSARAARLGDYIVHKQVMLLPMCASQCEQQESTQLQNM